MPAIIRKSEIIHWSRENIQTVPDTNGVYTLRSSTTIESILYIGMAGPGRLRDRLLEHFNSQEIGGINYFDWYETNTEEDARILESMWITKYHPPYNT
jgi:excinuclease UvrABC nuclease subunit